MNKRQRKKYAKKHAARDLAALGESARRLSVSYAELHAAMKSCAEAYARQLRSLFPDRPVIPLEPDRGELLPEGDEWASLGGFQPYVCESAALVRIRFMNPIAPSDQPVDDFRKDIAVTYLKAQSVQSLLSGLGYSTPANREGILLNARNSGTPSTEEEAREWAKRAPFVKRPPIQPEDFETKHIEAQVVAGHDSGSFNYNAANRVLLLVTNQTGGPAAVVVAVDDFLDAESNLVSEAAAREWMVKRVSPSNPLNR